MIARASKTALMLAALASVQGPGVWASEPPALKAPAVNGGPGLPPGPSAAVWMPGLRALSDLQQQTVLGNRDALARQHSLMRELDLQLVGDVEPLRSTSHTRLGVIKYVLSGGTFSVLDRFLTAKAFPETEMALARGALAYAKGDRQEAAEYLSKVDPRSLIANLGGHVALAQAILISDVDRQASLALTNEARLLSPGTIIEETALRLALDLAIVGGDRRQFERTAMRYLLRFPMSLYALPAHAQIARILAASHDVETDSGLQWLAQLVSALPRERRRELLLELADLALRGGNVVTAERAASLASEDGREMSNSSKAQLVAIQGAAMLFGSRRNHAVQLLEVASGANTSQEVSGLLAAARTLVAIIEAPPQIREALSSPLHGVPTDAVTVPPRPRTAPATRESTASRRPEEAMAKAREAISLADRLIEEARL